jgi:hypothetical protein
MNESSETGRDNLSAAQTASAAGLRQQDAIYQRGRIAARVNQYEIDLDAKEIRFNEIYQSDPLVLPDECEFQKYVIIIQRIAYASKIDPTDPGKGRVLRGCVADILGYPANGPATR